MTQLLESKWTIFLVGALSYLGSIALFWQTLQAPANVGSSAARTAAQTDDSDPLFDATHPEVEQLIAELKKEKEALAVREKQLTEWETRLQAERQEINLVTQTISKLQQDFDKAVIRVRQDESVNLRRLAKVYSAMTSDEAAAILKEIDDEQVVKILMFMREFECAPILAALAQPGPAEAKRAGLISERLRLSLNTKGVKPK